MCVARFLSFVLLSTMGRVNWTRGIHKTNWFKMAISIHWWMEKTAKPPNPPSVEMMRTMRHIVTFRLFETFLGFSCAIYFSFCYIVVLAYFYFITSFVCVCLCVDIRRGILCREKMCDSMSCTIRCIDKVSYQCRCRRYYHSKWNLNMWYRFVRQTNFWNNFVVWQKRETMKFIRTGNVMSIAIASDEPLQSMHLTHAWNTWAKWRNISLFSFLCLSRRHSLHCGTNGKLECGY